ncbi:sensor histidine kinase [Elstera cyanobacteriorum]|uniref:sensor histidine kinase n=1 Tax=Elstera cyanobacteriorum TaxID=2022747 RepID=UPI002356B6B8|nr:HAMP domain-containing sensor histidine kinase [Elstera cyanobacteriorum]MCK6441944.1 HAMP domain-containing histidine kinase [Elstera cyanobacteriorum]
MLTFLGTQGDRVLLLILFIMLWLSVTSSLEFAGLAQRTSGWTRVRATLWAALLLAGSIMAAQTLTALPTLIGGNLPLSNRLTFFLGGSAAILAGSFYALHLITRPAPTVACILTASAALTAGQYATSLLVIYQLMPLQAIRLDYGLVIASLVMAVATKTGTFAISTTSSGPMHRLFAAAILVIGLAGSRFLLIIATSGLPLTEVVTEADRIPLFSLGLHASPALIMIGLVVIVTVLVGLMALMMIVRPWRANRDALRSRRAQDLLRRLSDADLQRQTLEDRLTEVTRQRDLALAERTRTLSSLQSSQATLNQEIAQRRQILDEHRQLLDRQAQQHGAFVAAAVHETRHMVQDILGDMTRMVDPLRDALGADQKKLLGRISENSDHLLGLLCTLSDYARLQGPSQALPLRAVPALELLGRLRNTLDPVAREAGLRADWPQDIALAGVAFQTDGERLYQVVAELVRNALRFNRSGGAVSITVEPVLTRNGEAPQALRLVVADTGIGIAPDHAAALFSPFARRPANLPLGPDLGVGLGLAIAQRLAESLGSRIVFASEPGIGSRFWLDIPAADVPVSVPTLTPQPQSRALDYPLGASLKAAQ